MLGLLLAQVAFAHVYTASFFAPEGVMLGSRSLVQEAVWVTYSAGGLFVPGNKSLTSLAFDIRIERAWQYGFFFGVALTGQSLFVSIATNSYMIQDQSVISNASFHCVRASLTPTLGWGVDLTESSRLEWSLGFQMPFFAHASLLLQPSARTVNLTVARQEYFDRIAYIPLPQLMLMRYVVEF